MKLSKLDIFSPYDREIIEAIPMHDWAVADAALNEARAVLADRTQWIPAYRRTEILLATAARVEADSESFAHLIAREGGKPITDARIEVSRAILGLRYAATHIDDGLRGEDIPTGMNAASMGRSLHVTREPIGVVVAIAAFNHPLNLVVHQVAPAIAVGCPVIIKPALATPLTCLKLIEILYECGLPAPWCRAIICANDVAESLATNPRVNLLNFIGSAKVGWHLRSRLAPGTRCLLEHGGNAPAILLPYANQDEALPALLKGGLSHAGQVCVSVQRIYIPWAEAGHIARKIGEMAEGFVVGNPINDATQIGPLIHPREVQRVHAAVTQAIAGGGKLMCGGQPISETLYQPTIFFDPPADALVSAEEIFGPVICVYGYDDLDDAIKRANASRYSFAASVWGRQHDDIRYACERLNASHIMINDATSFRLDWMPFGGRGASGLGISGLPYTLRDYTQHKMIVDRGS